MNVRMILCSWAISGMVVTMGAPIDFSSQIKPLLEEKCYRCHDAEKVKGDLRLDTPEGIMAGGESGAVLVPGEPNESPVYVMTTYPKDDPDYMPQKGKGLSKREQGLLKAWIEEGALFGDGFVHEPIRKVKSKFSRVDPDDSRKYRIMGEAVEVVAKLREAGLLVDTVNHDASLFEISYTYVERKAGQFDFAFLDPLKDSIRKVILSRTEVTSEDLRELRGVQGIESLDLSRTNIDDEALEHISKLENLKILNLRDTNVTDSGIRKLAVLKNLERVHVWGSSVTPDGARWLEKRVEGLAVNVGVPILAPIRRNGP